MKTPEEIIRENIKLGPQYQNGLVDIRFDDFYLSCHTETEAEILLSKFSQLIQQALDQQIELAMQDTPLTEERYQYLHRVHYEAAIKMARSTAPWSTLIGEFKELTVGEKLDLFRMIDHLKSQVAFLSKETAAAEAYEEGKKAGWRLCRAEQDKILDNRSKPYDLVGQLLNLSKELPDNK